MKINFCSNIGRLNGRLDKKRSPREIDIDLMESIVINLLFINALFHVAETQYFNAFC